MSMKNFKLNVSFKKLLADTTTPVSIYLRLRDVFPNSLLLESSDYHSRENNMSYVCCDPIAGIMVDKGELVKYYPDKSSERQTEFNLTDEVFNFRKTFTSNADTDLKFIADGLFGYFTHEAVEYFEDIKLKKIDDAEKEIPVFQYHIYRYIIAIDHFKNQLHIIKNESDFEAEENGLDKIEYLIQNKNFPEYSFKINGEESSNQTDEEFIALVEKMKTHIFRGDVFQLVLSRRFQQKFSGDEFNVYRALRNINPSPYLFFFDYGDYKLMGSSPESQIIINNGKAIVVVNTPPHAPRRGENPVPTHVYG